MFYYPSTPCAYNSAYNSAERQGGGFNPIAVGNLQLWLDASETSTITATTGNVTAWADKSGNGNDAITAAGTPRTGDSTANGKNVIDFSGTDWLSLPSALYTIPNSSNTLVIVSERASEDDSVDATIGMATGTTDQWYHVYSSFSGIQSFSNRAAGGGAVSSTGNTNTSLNICEMRRVDGAQSISVNNETPSINVNATNVATIDDAFIGAAGSGDFPFIGRIAEILIYDRNLSASEILVVNRYLAIKWGITLG